MLSTSLQFSQIELQELKQRYIHDFEQHKNTYKDVEHINTELKKLENTADYLENQSRRNNLRFDGIKERAGESWADTEDALRRVLQQQLKLPVEQAMTMPIALAHRTGGAPNDGRDRTIVVKFRYFKDRDAVLQAARVNKPQGMFVNEDFSQRVVSRRKELIPAMREARDRGKVAYLSFDKLIVKDRPEQR